MATAAEKIAPFDYTLKSDEDAQQRTVFKLRPLYAHEYIAAGEIMNRQTMADAYVYTLRQALMAWSGFFGRDGKEVAFSKNQSENIARLSVEQLPELANKILESSALDETERKN